MSTTVSDRKHTNLLTCYTDTHRVYIIIGRTNARAASMTAAAAKTNGEETWKGWGVDWKSLRASTLFVSALPPASSCLFLYALAFGQVLSHHTHLNTSSLRPQRVSNTTTRASARPHTPRARAIAQRQVRTPSPVLVHPSLVTLPTSEFIISWWRTGSAHDRVCTIQR